jgi:hypothetical protein
MHNFATIHATVPISVKAFFRKQEPPFWGLSPADFIMLHPPKTAKAFFQKTRPPQKGTVDSRFGQHGAILTFSISNYLRPYMIS